MIAQVAQPASSRYDRPNYVSDKVCAAYFLGALGAVCSQCNLSWAVMNSLGSGTMNAFNTVVLDIQD